MDDPVRVLVVDEDRDVLDLTRTFLEREDDAITVVTAGSAAEALDRVAEEPIDAVVSDYRMPGTDGLEFSEALCSRGVDLPFVLFSAVEDSAMAEAARAPGIDCVVRKQPGTAPYAEIASAIRDAVDS